MSVIPSMHPLFRDLTRQIEFTNDLKRDIYQFLTVNQCPGTADHCMDVGAEAKRIALLFGADAEAAETAGWLHDISAVFPSKDRIAVASRLQIEILPEEEAFPMIIHQKISTLRARSTLLDQVLFVADKIAWDQTGEPPYLQELQRNLRKSIAHGAFSYIRYLWERKESLKVVHPWLKEAYEELKEHCSRS